MGGNPFCEFCKEEKDTDIEEIQGRSVSICWDCLTDYNERHEESPCPEAPLPPVK